MAWAVKASPYLCAEIFLTSLRLWRWSPALPMHTLFSVPSLSGGVVVECFMMRRLHGQLIHQAPSTFICWLLVRCGIYIPSCSKSRYWRDWMGGFIHHLALQFVLPFSLIFILYMRGRAGSVAQFFGLSCRLDPKNPPDKHPALSHFQPHFPIETGESALSFHICSKNRCPCGQQHYFTLFPETHANQNEIRWY